MVEWDDRGRPLRWVTEVEPEFDAQERDDWHALAEWDEAHCKSCGQLRMLCEDPDTAWFPQRHVCYASAAREMTHRQVNHYFEKAKPGPENGWTHPMDGWSIWVSPHDLTPDDNFDGALPT